MKFLGAAICAACLCACGNSQGNPPVSGGGFKSDQARAPGEYLVTLAPQIEPSAINDVFGSYDIKAIKPLGQNLYLMQLANDPGPAEIEQRAKTSPAIKAVQPNFRYRNR